MSDCTSPYLSFLTCKRFFGSENPICNNSLLSGSIHLFIITSAIVKAVVMRAPVQPSPAEQ